MIAVSAGGTIYHQDDIMSGDVHRAEGWKVPAATMVKNAVSVPVVATGVHGAVRLLIAERIDIEAILDHGSSRNLLPRISWIRSSMTASATWSAWAAAFWLSANG